MAGSPQHDLSLIDRATSVRGQARSIVQQAAHLPHRLGRHPDSGKCSDGQHLGQPSGIHPIGVAAGAQALEIHGIGEEDPVDVRRKHVVHFKGTSGYLEGNPAGPIQLGKQLRPPVRGIGGPEVLFFTAIRDLGLPLTAVNVPSV